ncbi:MAG: hypothetical protein Q8R66_02830 [Methanobacteriaceae archaeon]|nr:hypothetical protein [Methanobacteriaceae archaeon]
MGVMDKFEEKAVDSARNRAQKNMEQTFEYLKSFDDEDVYTIINEICEIKNSGLYNELIKASTKDKFNDDKGFLGDLPKHRIEILAYDNLKMGGLLTTIFTKSIITVKDTFTLYSLIESVYFMHKNPLEKEDMLNIYFSGLDERIILALDNFDLVSFDELPEITSNYFKALDKVKWEDKTLFSKISELMFSIQDLVCENTGYTVWESTYAAMEDLFVQFLAACSAVNDGRLEIGIEDTIVAYKTFLKLIKTDVTMYKAIPERISDLDNHSNYLVCKSCGSYYQIPEGESMDYYSDICECGGKLKHLGSNKS